MASKISNLMIDIGDFIIEKIIGKITPPIIIFVLGVICGYTWCWMTIPKQ